MIYITFQKHPVVRRTLRRNEIRAFVFSSLWQAAPWAGRRLEMKIVEVQQ